MTGPLAVQAAAESVSRQLAFPGAAPAWVIVLVIVPLLVLFVGSIYRREGESASPRAKFLLGALRFAAVALLLGVIFQPVSENVLPVELSVTVRSRIPGSVAIGMCRPSNTRCS